MEADRVRRASYIMNFLDAVIALKSTGAHANVGKKRGKSGTFFHPFNELTICDDSNSQIGSQS